MHFLSKALGVTLLISITAWILFLLGFSWPHYISQDSTQEFYIHDNYYFFVKSAKAQSIEILPRFCSFFLEPGHLASTCCFFIFINKFNIRQWYVLLMILAVILSFSLAGYVLLIISLISYLQLYGKHFKRNLIVCLSILIGIWMFFQSFNDGNNVVNERIISRLIFEDGEMVGNNRFSMLFEKKFQKLIKTEDVYFGAQRHLSKIDYKYNWMDGSAGWKRCIAMYGIIGTFLILIFYLSYLLSIWSYSGFLFFIIFFIANCIRDYPLREYWLYTYLLAIPILQRQYKDFKTKNIN
jgi:hypothetical protein